MATSKKPRSVSAAKRFAQIERISILGVTERMGPLGLHMYAESFLAAARALPPGPVPFEPVRPYVVCHSIELGLKAFLSLQGAAMLELAEGPYGHNLEALLQKADKKGLRATVRLTAAQRSAICHATTYYSGKVFEYPAIGEAVSGYPHLPSIEPLLEAASTLVDSIRQQCHEAK